MKSIPCRGAACLRLRVGKSKTGRTAVHPHKKPFQKNLMLILAGYFFFFLAAIPAHAAIIQAASCSQQDVQAAINQAQDGDTVLVPAGECTWTTAVSIGKQLTWGANPTYESKQITLQGAGKDITIIESDSSYGGRLLNIRGVENKFIRVTGFTFKGMQRLSATHPAISLAAPIWRIDHCNFDSSNITPWQQGRGVIVSGQGVIDNCEFVDSYQAIAIFGDGDDSWNRALTPGTVDAVYIENCFVDNTRPFDGGTDAYNGARYVFRYNNVVNEIVSHHGRDTGGYRSPLWFELYHNVFNYTLSSTYFTSANFRGGTGVIFNNSWTGNYGGGIRLVYYCANPSGASCGWSLCTAYPCLDQHGRGPDMNNDGIQDIVPLYEWNNTINEQDMAIHVEQYTAEFVQEGRDYFSNMYQPRYVPYPYPHPLTLTDYPGEKRALELQGFRVAGQAQLSWQAVTGAVNYRVVRGWDEGAAAVTTVTTFSEALISGEAVYMVYAMGADGKILAAEGKLFDQSLTIISPNGSEVWRKGEPRQITWTAQGISETLTIEILQGATVLGTVATGINAASGSYAWTVGRLANGSFVTGQNLKIRICTADGAVLASMDI